MRKWIAGIAVVVLSVVVCFQAELAQDEGTRLFLLKVQQDTANYFWEEVNPQNGLVKDSADRYSPCSVSAIGFGLAALCILEKNGWKPRAEVLKRVIRTLRTLRDKVEHEHGFFYHFVSMNNCRRVWKSEASSIDTALVVAGALFAGEYFKNTEAEELANHIYERVDWPWMMNGKNVMSMGWTPEAGFLPYYWDTFNEGMLLYALAIGSPTYPIGRQAWWAWKRPVTRSTAGPMVYCRTGSLFVYQFPHAFLDLRHLNDGKINYWKNSVKATLANRYFCLQQRSRFKTYQEDIWGLTASLGPNGYKGYGAQPADEALHDGTVSPSAVAGSLPFTPKLSIRALKAMYDKYGPSVYGRYGFYDAFNDQEKWSAQSYIGVNQGISVVMIENLIDHTIWAYLMKHPAIQKWARSCMVPISGRKKVRVSSQREKVPPKLALSEM